MKSIKIFLMISISIVSIVLIIETIIYVENNKKYQDLKTTYNEYKELSSKEIEYENIINEYKLFNEENLNYQDKITEINKIMDILNGEIEDYNTKINIINKYLNSIK